MTTLMPRLTLPSEFLRLLGQFERFPTRQPPKPPEYFKRAMSSPKKRRPVQGPEVRGYRLNDVQLGILPSRQERRRIARKGR